ncbi:MAG: DUF2147 domain-containing protein [Bacteroidota bacterium]
MKPTIAIFSFLLLFSLGLSAQTPADKILGTWANEEGTSHLKIYQNGNRYHAKIVWLAEPNDRQGHAKKDVNNPNSSLRNRPVLGLDVITGLRYEEGRWVSGTLYAPRKGKTVNCNVYLKADGSIKLKVWKSMYSNTQTLTRVG